MSTPTYFPTEADFRRWLEANHATAPELLVGFWKKGSGKPSIDWPQARDPFTVTPGLTRGPPAFASLLKSQVDAGSSPA